PAFSYISLVRPMALPPSRCTSTWWPLTTSSRAPAGVRPMRYSWFLISFGTPISMVPSRASDSSRCARSRASRPLYPAALGRRLDRSPERLDDPVDVRRLHDQRRRHREGVAGDAHHQVLLGEAAREHVVAARRRGA